MPRKVRLAYFAHSLRSDWNNGNAHFLRGLMRALWQIGHDVTVYEPQREWSIDNLRDEPTGYRSLDLFLKTYAELDIQTYPDDESDEFWQERLRGAEIVILHEWNPPRLAQCLLAWRESLRYKLLFHDTHHRASSSPEQIERFGIVQFDGVIAFGEALSDIYRARFGLNRVWTLHEAADTTVFSPRRDVERDNAIVWIGNWGEGERAKEIAEFLLKPAAILGSLARATIYGVRYPEEALMALEGAGVAYGGYLANLDAPAVFALASATLHVPRQQYSSVMNGIPTIRVFEALASGIPLVSAPWDDTEGLFRAGDFRYAHTAAEMTDQLRLLLTNKNAAEDQAAKGLETVLTRHTCIHRAKELTAIFEEVLA